jgi:hypothetical protein
LGGKNMSLNFKELSRRDQVKAINETISQHDESFLAYLIASNEMDLFSWFSFHLSEDGSDYWIDKIKSKKDE